MSNILREVAPAYRVAHHIDGCSVLELLTAVIGGRRGADIARQLAGQYNLLQLEQATVSELQRAPGIGKATAVRLVAALELGRRALRPPQDGAFVDNIRAAVDVLMPRLSGLAQEHFVVVGLDGRNKVRYVETLYKGTVNMTTIRIGEIFSRAIREVIPSIIMAHNHPSGDARPSLEDVDLTKQVVAAGKLLDIKVLDHLIIGGQRALSLRQEGVDFD